MPDTPFTEPKELAWMLMKTSESLRLAISTRGRKRISRSFMRVIWTLMPLLVMMRERRVAMARVTSFSRVPLVPMAPWSVPPWPGSTVTASLASRFSESITERLLLSARAWYLTGWSRSMVSRLLLALKFETRTRAISPASM
ncbi:hypothetical protein D3C72_1712470 [compost metagenome]